MRSKTLSKIIVILFEISIIDISVAQPSLDEELEKTFEQASLSDESLFMVAEKINLDGLEPMIAYVIRYIRTSPVFKDDSDPPCEHEEIKSMASFHNFMSRHSMKYRNIDRSSEVIRSLINSHWNVVIECLKKENNKIEEKLGEAKWQFLSKMVKRFWRITSTKGDIYFLDIASEISTETRRIRDARESPNDWAKMLRGLMIEQQKNDLQTSEERIEIAVYNAIIGGINIDATGMKSAKEGYIGKLYDQLILENCKRFQEDQYLVILLKTVVGLAEATQWPKVGREDFDIFETFDEPEVGQLALGMVVCNQLVMDESFRKLAIENGNAIIRDFDDKSPSDSGKLDEIEMNRLLSAVQNNRVGTVATQVVKYLLEPEMAYVIDYAQSFPVFRRIDLIHCCNNAGIEAAKKFHRFMMEHSVRYRNMYTDLRIIRTFISAQWKYLTVCLSEENRKFEENSKDHDSLRRMATKFLRIARITGDFYFLDTASDLSAGRRKIRDASESPRDWAEIFKEILLLKIFESLFDRENEEDRQPNEGTSGNIYSIFERRIEVDAITGVRYPREGYMEELYGMIEQQCETIQTDQKLVESINRAKKLAEVAHWPKTSNFDKKLFGHILQEPVLGPLTLTSAVCNQLNDYYRDRVVDNGVAIVAAFTDMRQHDGNEVDDDHLEDLLTSGVSKPDYIGDRAKKILTEYLDPNLVRIIELTKFSPIFEGPFLSCDTGRIEHMKNFHNLMLQASERYRNIDHNFISVKTFVDGHWKYMVRCFDLEGRKLREKFIDNRWKSLANIFTEFWNISSLRGDLYSLNIASDLLTRKRNIRGADYSPRDWAKLIAGALQKEMFDSLNSVGNIRDEDLQEIATMKVKNVIEKRLQIDAITGKKYPSENFVVKLYDRLILERCKEFQENSEIAQSLDHIINLGGFTHWPKRGRMNGKLLLTKIDEAMLGSLALGRVVCQYLDEHFRKAVINNEIAIFDALIDQIFVDTPSIVLSDQYRAVSMLNEDEIIKEFCENSRTLVDLTGSAKKHPKDERSTTMFFEQTAQLWLVASRSPTDFLCQGEEIESIHGMSNSVSRILSVVKGPMLDCFGRLNALMLDLKKHFVNKCLKSVVAGIGELADDATKRHVVMMPKFELITEKECALSLTDSLIYAGSLFSGKIKFISPLNDIKKWREMLRETGQVLLRGPGMDVPEGLKKYWNRVEQKSLNDMKPDYQKDGKVRLWLASLYRKTVEWCNIFGPDPITVQSRYMKEVQKVVRIASSLLIWENGYGYFSDLDVGFEEEFLLKQSVLGYSVCNQLDPTIELRYKVTA